MDKAVQQRRININEMMGWKQWKPAVYDDLWMSPEGRGGLYAYHMPDPENNADDDYKILEWAREQPLKFFSDFRDALRSLRMVTGMWHGSKYSWNYKVGDYMRAVLLTPIRK